MTLLDKLRALLTDAEAEENPAAEAEDEAAEADDVAEDEADDVAEDEAAEADDIAEDEAVEDETTPSVDDETDSAEIADLRATILEQAAEIETLRNQVAELGGYLDTDDADDADETDDTDDVDVVEAFDADYNERKAQLAEILERD